MRSVCGDRALWTVDVPCALPDVTTLLGRMASDATLWKPQERVRLLRRVRKGSLKRIGERVTGHAFEAPRKLK